MTPNEAQTQVKNKVGDTSADVSNEVDMAVKNLDNYFGVIEIDSTTYDTTADQNYIDVSSDDIIDVYQLKIGGEEIPKLSEEENFTKHQLENVKRFDYKNGKIWLTWTPETAEDCEIYWKRAFGIPADDADFEFPRKLDELVVLGATWRYYHNLMAKTAQSREDLPDISPYEISTLAKRVKEQYDTLLQEIKSQA